MNERRHGPAVLKTCFSTLDGIMSRGQLVNNICFLFSKMPEQILQEKLYISKFKYISLVVSSHSFGVVTHVNIHT